MPMTPEEYAAKEFNVSGWKEDEPVYAPEENSSGQTIDPNIAVVMNGGPIKPEPVVGDRILEMQHEYNFVLPIELRRAEVATQVGRANFWNALAAILTSLVK